MAPSPASQHAAHVQSTVEAASSAAQSLVAASWRRSLLNHHLEPGTQRPNLTVTEGEMEEAKARMGRLLSVASDSMDRLFRAVGNTGCCVVLSDADGLLVDRRGTAGDEKTFRQWGLWPGALWSEDAEGTNGVGTCIAEGRPVTIHREQHFFARNTAMSCMDAPIHDHEGRLAAVLDVSSCRADDTAVFLQLIQSSVIDTARRIESDNFRAAFAGSRILMGDDHGRKGTVLLAVDRDDLVVGATRAARQIFGLTDESLKTPRPAQDVLSGQGSAAAGMGAVDLKSAERGAILRALARTDGNLAAAARQLKLGRATLYRRLDQLEIE